MKNMLFAKRVEALRKGKGMTQEGLAALFDYTKQAVQQWENSGKIPRHEVLMKLSEYFGVTTDYLLGKIEVAGSDKDEKLKAAVEAVRKISTPEHEIDAERITRIMSNPNSKEALDLTEKFLELNLTEDERAYFLKMAEYMKKTKSPS